jgi:hypothetical protein
MKAALRPHAALWASATSVPSTKPPRQGLSAHRPTSHDVPPSPAGKKWLVSLTLSPEDTTGPVGRSSRGRPLRHEGRLADAPEVPRDARRIRDKRERKLRALLVLLEDGVDAEKAFLPRGVMANRRLPEVATCVRPTADFGRRSCTCLDRLTTKECVVDRMRVSLNNAAADRRFTAGPPAIRSPPCPPREIPTPRSHPWRCKRSVRAPSTPRRPS